MKWDESSVDEYRGVTFYLSVDDRQWVKEGIEILHVLVDLVPVYIM